MCFDPVDGRVTKKRQNTFLFWRNSLSKQGEGERESINVIAG